MAIVLRDYQEKAIAEIWDFLTHQQGDPCLVAPTSFGKSIVIAQLSLEAISRYPGTHVLMVTHQKELVSQDAEKMRLLGLDCGVYSAGLGMSEVKDVTCASIQTIYNHIEELPKIHLCIVDEAHLINHNDTGRYRKLITALREKSPTMRLVGFTATPYRMGHGLITDEPAIFTDLIETVTIKELVRRKFLTPLTSKSTNTEIDVSGVKTRGGEFIEADLQRHVDDELTNEQAVDETLKRAGGRKHWLVFCTGIEHAEHICEELVKRGINTKCLTGKTPKKERDEIITQFKNGEITAISSIGVLTTGFDAPCVDLIVMLRPTMSTGLHLQMLGRGMRLNDGKMDCLVLDFARNMMRCGTVTNPVIPTKAGKGGKGVAPAKTCPKCLEIVATSSRICPTCGYEFPKKEKKYNALNEDIDIMDEDAFDRNLIHPQKWYWRYTQSKNGNEMFMVKIDGYPLEGSVTQWLMPWRKDYKGLKDSNLIGKYCSVLDSEFIEQCSQHQYDKEFNAHKTMNNLLSWSAQAREVGCWQMNKQKPPKGMLVKTKVVGKYRNIKEVNFNDCSATTKLLDNTNTERE